MVGVGVENGYLEGDVVLIESNALPGEGAGDLQRDVGEGLLAVVAEGEQGADGDVLFRRAEMDVKVEGGEGDGLALGVFGGGGFGQFLGSGRRGLGGGLAVFVERAGEDDLRSGIFGLLRRRGLLRCRSGGGGLRDRRDCQNEHSRCGCAKRQALGEAEFGRG